MRSEAQWSSGTVIDTETGAQAVSKGSEMGLTSMTQRRAVAGAIGAGTVLLALFAGEPSGLLVASPHMHLRGQAGLRGRKRLLHLCCAAYGAGDGRQADGVCRRSVRPVAGDQDLQNHQL